MATRLKGVLVTFEDDIREDDAEAQINAIRCLRGVLSVEPIPTDIGDYMARERVARDLYQQVHEVFFQHRGRDKKRNGG